MNQKNWKCDYCKKYFTIDNIIETINEGQICPQCFRKADLVECDYCEKHFKSKYTTKNNEYFTVCGDCYMAQPLIKI